MLQLTILFCIEQEDKLGKEVVFARVRINCEQFIVIVKRNNEKLKYG